MTDNTAAIPVILGETASGKTAVGIELAKALHGEIISVDSRKVYKGLSVGTASPEGIRKGETLLVEGIPHYLIGHLAPDSPYTAGDFAHDATQLIDAILERGKKPVLVGGTGFYFKALAQGLPVLPKRNDALRSALAEEIEKNGVAPLFEKLKAIDPEAAAAMTSNDKHKIIRALEIHSITGRPFSYWKNLKQPIAKRNFVVMGVRFPKELIEKRIEERSRRMVDQGMIEETARVLQQGYSPDCPALASFGYREAVQVIQGALPKKEFLPKLIHGTKAYAKRQRTWFRTQIKPLWFELDSSSQKNEISMKMKAFLDNVHV